MAFDRSKLEKLLGQPFSCPVYYFSSTEEALLRETAQQVKQALLAQEQGAEATRVDGPVPSLGEVIAAAGAISFFGTRRVVEVKEMMPSSMADKDVSELADLFGQLENAVLVVTALHKDKKAATSKKAKLLIDAAAKAGFAGELEKPGRRENLDFMKAQAQAIGCVFAPGAAEALLDRAGENRPLLQNEVAKLAAVCSYGTITGQAVEAYSVRNIEADVFQLVRAITSGKKIQAFGKLNELLELRYEPIMISGALAGSYVDMYRARLGSAAKQPAAAVAKQFGYSNPYRIQKAGETASRYSLGNLRECIFCLSRLDKELKSSALRDKSVLLQAAVGQLILLGKQ